MKKKVVNTNRNWTLVFVASALILMGLALTALAVVNVVSFGWWSLLVGVIGSTAVAAAVMSIVKNDPSWIFLDLIIPF